MANVFNPLNDVEQAAYDACATAMSSLTSQQQHVVLKEIAFRLGREVVLPGAVRAAAAASAARSMTSQSGNTGTKSSGKKSSNEEKNKDKQAYEAWLNNEGLALKKARDQIVMDKDPTAEQLAMRTAASQAIRNAYAAFRSSGGNPEDKKVKASDNDLKTVRDPVPSGKPASKTGGVRGPVTDVSPGPSSKGKEPQESEP
jgi:hypothetical protein